MTDARESDEALMGRYARGDAAAFVLLYRRHELRIWRDLERNVGNRATADELMQEVWFAVARDAFLLQIEGDLSVEEVATITQSSFEATKSRLRYARMKLRELLSEYA